MTAEVPEPPYFRGDVLEIVDELRASIAPSQILTPDQDLTHYEQDRFHEGKAACVLRPKTLEQVRDIVRWAYRHRVLLIAQGANTSGMGGAIPDGSGCHVLISFELLLERLEIDVVNRTITVSAGYDLDTIDDAVREYGMTLPVDLGASPSVGGMISTNTGGSKVLGYGDVRRMVRGLEVVLADDEATVISELAGLRKNNVGLDFKQLFIGTMGSFGLVTAATFELPRRAKSVAVAWVALADDAAALTLLQTLEAEAGDVLTAFEVVPSNMAEMGARVGVAPPFPLAETPALTVLIELASPGADRPGDTLEDRLLAIIDRAVGAGVALDARFGPADRLWDQRHALIRPMAKEGYYIMCDLSVIRTRLGELRERVGELMVQKGRGWDWYAFGHYGDGGVHLALVWPDSNVVPVDAEKGHELTKQVYKIVAQMGGSFCAEHPIGTDKAEAYHEYRDKTVQKASAAIKQMLDPRGILGRVNLGPDAGLWP